MYFTKHSGWDDELSLVVNHLTQIGPFDWPLALCVQIAFEQNQNQTPVELAPATFGIW